MASEQSMQSGTVSSCLQAVPHHRLWGGYDDLICRSQSCPVKAHIRPINGLVLLKFRSSAVHAAADGGNKALSNAFLKKFSFQEVLRHMPEHL